MTAYQLTKEFKDYCETRFTVIEKVLDENGNPIINTLIDENGEEINSYKTVEKTTSMAGSDFKYLADFDEFNENDLDAHIKYLIDSDKKLNEYYKKIIKIEILAFSMFTCTSTENDLADICTEKLNDACKEWLNYTGIPDTIFNINQIIHTYISSDMDFLRKILRWTYNYYDDNNFLESSLNDATYEKDNTLESNLILSCDIKSCSLPRRSLCLYFSSEKSDVIDLCIYHTANGKSTYFKINDVDPYNIHNSIQNTSSSILQSLYLKIMRITVLCSSDGMVKLSVYRNERKHISVTFGSQIIGTIEINTGKISSKVKQTLQNYPVIFHNLTKWRTVFKGLFSLLSKKPSRSVRIGDVYHLKKPFCGHNYWIVISEKNGKILLKCYACGKKISVEREQISCIGRYAYNSDLHDFLVPALSTNVSKKQISKADVIVLSSAKHCTNLNHKIDDCVGILPIEDENGKTNIEVDIGYCRDCNKYIMLTSTYLKIKGNPICMVKDLRTGKVYNKPNDEFGINSTEHIIHKYGYNVRSGNGMLSTDRQQILVKLINNGILSKSEIISHLEYCIRMASGRESMSLAIRKWEQDIEYLRNYEASEGNISVNSITLKYRK